MSNKYFQLGASLYTPATNKNLLKELDGLKSESKSMIVDTEDAVSEERLEEALENLEAALKRTVDKSKIKKLRFIRPRNSTVLKRILKMEGVEKIDGFVLPKCTIDSSIIYREILENCGMSFGVMPTIESIEMTKTSKIEQLKAIFESFEKTEIICIRIGGNDLFNELGLKRHPKVTIYETPLRIIIEKIVLGFKTSGFEIASPVFDIIDDRITLQRELEYDMSYGFFAKTAIHPSQASIIEQHIGEYAKQNVSKAQGVITESNAVYIHDGQMMEKTCHINWSQRIVLLSSNY
ncbi:aldolase/citrate lyase family protein [Vibrio parahaemolyticus]|uniref:aldolase/citrate lyase family protein n=1 Tax=Vibrio parahaemolyticus TaxID=670 RepID=UPI0031CC656E